jgi:uncharacterized small protein (DUF1192 family)
VIGLVAASLSLSLLLSGCTAEGASEAEGEGTADLSAEFEDDASRAEAEKLLINEQLDLKRAELDQKLLDLESVQGMLAALLAESHPDEELVATYQSLLAEIEAEIETIQAEIERLEGHLARIDAQFAPPTDVPSAPLEEDPLGDPFGLLSQDPSESGEPLEEGLLPEETPSSEGASSSEGESAPGEAEPTPTPEEWSEAAPL